MPDKHMIGLGDSTFSIAFYVENRPPIEPYQSQTELIPLTSGQIKQIAGECGNGWRKLFNVYAKFLFELPNSHYLFNKLAPSWQSYRDNFLCQAESGTALLFNPPNLSQQRVIKGDARPIHIIAGRTYAKKLLQQGKLQANLTWINEQFAVDLANSLIVSPYLDYRQLSNQKIEFLVKIIAALLNGELIKQS